MNDHVGSYISFVPKIKVRAGKFVLFPLEPGEMVFHEVSYADVDISSPGKTTIRNRPFTWPDSHCDFPNPISKFEAKVFHFCFHYWSRSWNVIKRFVIPRQHIQGLITTKENALHAKFKQLAIQIIHK
jgi:hypothetical protein